MVNKKKGVFKRKEYPVAKDSKLNDIADKYQLKIIKRKNCMEFHIHGIHILKLYICTILFWV